MSAARIRAAVLGRRPAVEPPAGACSIALAPFPGFLAPDIVGQTVSKTTSTAAGSDEQYAAGAAPLAFWGSGVRFISAELEEFSGLTAGLAQASLVVVTEANQQVIVGYTGDDHWAFHLQNGGGQVGAAGVIAGPDAIPSIGIDPVTRDVVAYMTVDGVTTQVTNDAFAPGGAAEGWLTGSVVIAGAFLAFQSDGTQRLKLLTDHESQPSSLPGGDWCGNPIS